MAKKPIKSINLLPEFLRTDKNSKFLSSTVDQLIQPPNLERLDGFIGSKFTPTYVSTSDFYIAESLPLRRDYQLEPALVIKDELGNVEQVKAIDDLANEITTEGGFNNDFDRLFRSDVYSFYPQIDLDKFVNYQKYYWLSTGPDVVTITGKQLNTTSTYTVLDNEIKSAWVFTPNGLTEDPTIVLYRGNTYTFDVDSTYRFYIKVAPSTGLTDVYDIEVTGNGAKKGSVTITVTENTPSTLYYTSDNVNYVQGKIVIKQATEDSYIDVDQEIIGKKNYTSGTKLQLTNGMKVRFGGEVYPEGYKDKEYFVEGVGKSIRLIDYTLLSGSEKLAAQYDDDFDASNFDQYPFDNFQQLPLNPEYLTINRSSKDLNPWSRYNRWIHEDVIIKTAEANGIIPVIPADKRAKRPIIEFVADLQLYNFGTTGISNIDLIDNETLDAFSIIEGSAGYHIDGVLLEQGHRVVFNADTDDMVRGKIYEVNFIYINGVPKLELKETLDHDPLVGASLSTNLGLTSSGKSWWYNGDTWQLSQQHESLNQAPLFDLFDSNGISYSSNNYDTDFSGSKVFSYEVGQGTPDPVLGFPLSYQNTVSVGSFKFKNYFNTDIISIFENNQVTTTTTALTYLRINDDTGSRFVNVWATTEPYEIPILQLFSSTEPTYNIELNAINDPDTTEFDLQIYIDGNKISEDQYLIIKTPKKCYIEFNNEIPSGTNVQFKIFTRALANSNGQYEAPLGLTNNPLNGPISTITLTEMSDHYKSMADRDPEFLGQVFGNNNTRDLPNISKYGTRLIANANPIAFSNFFLGIKEHDLIDAIQKSSDQYNQFKLALIKKITEIGNINNPVQALDDVLKSLNTDKDLNSPWYFSDMIAYGTDKTIRSWTVTNSENTIYPISQDFDLTSLGLRSVLVYLNDNQLILGKDYRFITNDSSVELLVALSEGDTIRVDDYFSTEGCYVPSTPTKLGLYPKFTPSIYEDNTYVTPTRVIQGHDGSRIVAYNDFRDAIILEYEKRVYNNLKTLYREELFDIDSVIPGAFRTTDYSLEEINTILQSDFLKWATFYNVDYATNSAFNLANEFTWNYTDSLVSNVDKAVNGNWRNVFKYLYDTDRPNTHPWEMLGFSEEPAWWQDEYGPAPYTSGNSILWNDLELGFVRQGSREGENSKYARPGLSTIIPVDSFGNIIEPSQLVRNTSPYSIRQNWLFGDQGPAETAWRRSSYWPFAVQRLLALTEPSSYSSLLYDTSRMNKNIADQWTYGDKFELLNPKTVIVPGTRDTLTAGYSVLVQEIGFQRTSNYRTTLRNDLDFLDFNLFYKVGGFVSKDKIQIIIDAIDPSSTSPGALLPQESYKLILNTGNPIKSSSVSGVIVQKSNGKFIVKGYDRYNPYFTIFTAKRNSTTPAITVGGISEPFVVWQSGDSQGGETGLSASETTTAESAPVGIFYRQGQIVRYGKNYYRTTVSHRSSSSFNSNNFQLLGSLPIVGGATVQIANGFVKTPVKVLYGTEFDKIQEVYDFLIGYGKWLESQGFIFDQTSKDLNEVLNWDLSAKEFLYWSTQNWAENSIITLSPFAERVKFTLSNSIVDNLFDNFYEYTVLKADGLPFPQKGLNVSRDEGICFVETINTTEGIYFIQLNSIQKEHAMVFDDRTLFNDVIYEKETGYRQRRMKLIGFRSKDWNGDYFSPGFVFDKAQVSDWKKFINYVYGDTVRYNGNYYSAKQNVVSSTTFDFNSWVLLNEKPTQDLIPNFEYKINQFEDFYSLDIDNFDAAQQKMAQHLIGYTPRVYLNNVFTNPISQYKFYQGFIKEKGTRNAVKKLSKASIFNLQGETDFTEEWAFRIGQYGSFTSYQELEIKLEEGTFIENPQIVNFVDVKPINPIDLIYYSTNSNIAILPEDYSPTNTFATTSTNIFKLPNAGYISFEDITATAYNENSLLDIANNDQIKNGDVIWLGFKSNGDWDVLRYDLLESRIVGVFVNIPGESITFVTDYFHGLSPGNVVSVTKFNDQVNGVYTVKEVSKLNQFTVSSDLTTILNEELLSPGLLYQFKGVRSSSFETLPVDYEMLRSPIGTKFWIDNQTQSGDYNWKVYRKIDNFSSKKVQSGYTLSNQQFGYSISKSKDSNVLIIGSTAFTNNIDNGRVFVFLKNRQTSSRLLSYSLNEFPNQYHTTSTTNFGHSVAYLSDIFPGTGYGLIFAGAPSVGNLNSTGTVLKLASQIGTLTTSSQAGAVKVSSVNAVGNGEDAEAVLLSPNYSNYERFGTDIAVNGTTDRLYIGAPGTASTGSGRVYVYQVLAPIASTNVVTTSTTGSNKLYVETTASIELGQTVWIPGVLNNIVFSHKVQTIYDDGLIQYVELDQNLPSKVISNSVVKFYSTASINTYAGIYTSTNGLLLTIVNTFTSVSPVVGHRYGDSLDITSDGKILAISAPGGDYVETFIDVNSPSPTRYVHNSTLGTGIGFGESIALSKGGEYLFVGAPYVKNSNDSFGAVVIYQNTGSNYSYLNTIFNPIPGAALNFGREIVINETTDTLVISAIGLNKNVPVEFDNQSTNFDSSSTLFFDVIENFGTVYVYNKENGGSRFVLSAELAPPIEAGLAGTNFGHSIDIDETAIYIGAPAIDSVTTSSIYQFNMIDSSKRSLELYKSYSNAVDIDTVQKVRLIDTFNETIVDYLDVIDPIKGKIAGIAEQELKYKSAYDPAIYSIGTAGVVTDNDTSWLDEHVGELWWDLSTVKYVWYEQGDLTYRKNNWGTIFPGATIDVYEWVRSTYLPSEWSAIADTSAGLTEGISGQPKYVDNSAIAVKQIYNSVSNSFSDVYYYWVKNKVTVPNSKNRRISAYQIASIIADPTTFGLKYAAILSSDAIALANVAPILVDQRVHLNIAYDPIKNNIQKHTEWALLEENSANSRPPVLYEKKLFDSLLGKDSLGNLVPDPSLTERTRYGIEIRPRQTMFKDRRQALRTLIEFTNGILLENQITGNYSFGNLSAQESPPDQFSREYDLVIEDNEGLNLIDTRNLQTASLTCTVFNGKIRSVTITNPGYGYRLPPKVSISNGGTGAVIETEIDSLGRVTAANIINTGAGYVDPPNLTVRPFSVIVLADNLYDGKWTKFEWNINNKQWERKQTQKYNTPLYWEYIDWKSSSYNDFIDFSYTVDQVYELDTLEDLIAGQYVKVKNVGDGRYVIVEKAADGEIGTFGKGYNLVYSQNGTIQILDKIWDLRNSNLGFDQDNNYDQTLYDQIPDLELGYILSALKEDIFINELKINWNLFFFKAVKYALTEQKLLDWAFKTSFINVVNYAGILDQRPVYKLKSSENYEDYIKEVKPYHSKIRSFTANHQIFEPSNSFFTDFDSPSYYNQNTNQFEIVEEGNSLLQDQPWKTWNENYLYSVGEVVVGKGGSGYTYPPQVTIESIPGDLGSGATAKAYITSGAVSKIEIINAGSGYKVAPRVILTGGGNADLVPAVAYAQLYNGKVRNNHVEIKFDRISRAPEITSRSAFDSFNCDGSASEFELTWYADPDKTKFVVTRDDELVLGSDYRIVQFKKIVNQYNKKFTKLVFVNNVPGYGQILKVQYSKNVELYNAVDRITEFYTATSGMPGNDLPQLMSGIEYPGVRLQGLPFDYSTDWDISYSPFGTSSYAENVNFYTKIDVAASISTGTDTVFVSTTTGIVVGQIVNLISATKSQTTASLFSRQFNYSDFDVKVLSINTVTNQVKFNSTISEAVVGVDSVIYIDGVLTTVTNTATIEFWSYDSNFNILDTAIDGGTWSTTTNTLIGALGVNPEEIIVDGDGFITPNTSYAPEELVPGETNDTLGINVYTRYNEGAPTMFNGLMDIYPLTTASTVLTFTPPNVSSIFVTFNGKNFTYTTGTSHLRTVNSSTFSFDWATNRLTVGPQNAQGKLGYTVVGIGGGRPNTEAGIIDRGIETVYPGSTEAEILSISTTATVKSAYVTVNGISIPKLSSASTTTLGYMLIANAQTSNRAAAHIYNLNSLTTSTIQAWFFGTENKYFNEFREEIFTIGSTATTLFSLTQSPGIIEPAAGNIIVEINSGSGFRRLQPPYISYYKVDPSVSIYAVDNNINRTGTPFINTNVRVYLNGIKLIFGQEYDFNFSRQTVEIRAGILKDGDVLAVLGIPSEGFEPLAEFDVEGNTLRLLTNFTNCRIKVTTFTNHDDMLVRTESFQGTLNRRFKVSRTVINSNYIWVSVDGILLVNSIDYTVLDDGRTIELSDKWNLNSANRVVITTISSDKLAETVIGYRIFRDLLGRTHYKRLSKSNSTVLTRPLYINDTEVHVADSSVLMTPLISKKVPGVVMIAGERIEYFEIDGNILKRLRRSTLGTGSLNYVDVGARVVDSSANQNIPFVDRYRKQTILTTSSSSTYFISGVSKATTASINGDQIYSDGIILSTTSTINPIDQIEVYYGGRKLRKSGIYYQDITKSFDNPEFNILGFTATTSQLPSTSIINSAYVVTATNEVWVYTGSIESESVNGYVYKGLRYLEPEYTVSVSVNTQTATAYATTALQVSLGILPYNLNYDIDGDGQVTVRDALSYIRLATNIYQPGYFNPESNYGTLLTQQITLNIAEGVQDNIRLTVIKRDFNSNMIWNDQTSYVNTRSLMDSSTKPARFLQAKVSELPSEYYLGGQSTLRENNGNSLTDDNNDPLEGF